MSTEGIEQRLQKLEADLAALGEKADSPKPKDNWDKLSSLSTLLSGVIIAAIGIWVNHSLVTGQQSAQNAQAAATQTLEKAHNETVEKQAQAALELQKQQASDSLDLEKARQRAQAQQAAATLQLQSDQSEAALKLQREQTNGNLRIAKAQTEEKILMDLLASPGEMCTAGLKILEQVDEERAVVTAVTCSVTTIDPNKVHTATKTLVALQTSANPEVRELAANAQAEIAVVNRVYQIESYCDSGHTQRQYDAVYASGNPAILEYGWGRISLRGGKLFRLLQQYSNAPNSRAAKEFLPYMGRLERGDVGLVSDEQFKSLLRTAGSDPMMRETQDKYDETEFWKPTMNLIGQYGIKLPLSFLAIHDSVTWTGPRLAQRRANAVTESLKGTPANGVDEREWVSKYVNFEWNAGSITLKALSPCVQSVFNKLLSKGNWNLDPPIEIGKETIE